MSHHILIHLSIIVLLGVTAQWLAWRFKLSPVLLLLISGFLAGPVTGFLHPSDLFGQLLFPGVSLAVALILFEGGLSLKMSELKDYGRPVLRLLTLGTVLTWLGIGLSAYLIFNLPPAEAILLGALLVVTGPTVIQPLLNHSRPTHSVKTVLNWEGIIIDPIGAMLAVLVFEVMHATHVYSTTTLVVTTVLKMVMVGTLCGILMSGVILILLKQFWLPDSLHNPFSFGGVIAAFALANGFQEEAGLVAVTVMGIILANQHFVNIKHIVHFKEDLRVLLLSTLFIVLAARLNLASIYEVGFKGLLFIGVLVLLVRPVSVMVSTWNTPLEWNERLFLSWMAPRGIVAAAVSSILVIKLEEAQLITSTTHLLEPITYVMIIGTVVIYSLTASPVAKKLGVKQKKANGVLMVGTHSWAKDLGKVLQDQGVSIQFVDSNRKYVYRARLDGLPVYYGSSLSEHILDELDFEGIGNLLALTSNDEVNTLAAMHFQEHFGRSSVYQLPPNPLPKGRKQSVSPKLSGRYLFRQDLTFEKLSELFEAGYSLKATQLTETYTYDHFLSDESAPSIPLFMIDETQELTVVSADLLPIKPQTNTLLISLVPGETVAHETEPLEMSRVKYV